MISTNNPIVRWRDSLYYSGVLASTMRVLANTGSIKLAFGHAAALTFGRELVRTLAWSMHEEVGLRPPVLAGGNAPPPVDSERYAGAARFGFAAAMTAAQLSDIGNTRALGLDGIAWAAYAAAGVSGLVKAGGLSGVVQAYKEMWNWPGDQGGGGGKTSNALRDMILTYMPGMGLKPIPLKPQQRPDKQKAAQPGI